jgi:phosphoribosyl 1,2-cyclic phosphodiesterase
LINLTFWGVRGSIPSPGPEAVKYGGNTPCVEVWFDDHLFILDAGSGIRPLGISLIKRFEKIKADIFITHMHWDHIQGLPFFAPFRSSANAFTIYGCEEADQPLDKIIADQMRSVYFPVSMDDMTADIKFQRLYEDDFQVGEVLVHSVYVNHPGNTLGYRFEYKGKSIVYISDNEPFNSILRFTPNSNPRFNRRLEDILEDHNMRLMRFIKGADVLIHDSQYFPDEYRERISWGHSPFTYTTDMAIAAGVTDLFLYHHDPSHSDDTLEKKLAEAQKIVKEKGAKLTCRLARERETFELV